VVISDRATSAEVIQKREQTMSIDVKETVKQC
jgi:hypothetical protein